MSMGTGLSVISQLYSTESGDDESEGRDGDGGENTVEKVKGTRVNDCGSAGSGKGEGVNGENECSETSSTASTDVGSETQSEVRKLTDGEGFGNEDEANYSYPQEKAPCSSSLSRENPITPVIGVIEGGPGKKQFHSRKENRWRSRLRSSIADQMQTDLEFPARIRGSDAAESPRENKSANQDLQMDDPGVVTCIPKNTVEGAERFEPKDNRKKYPRQSIRRARATYNNKRYDDEDGIRCGKEGQMETESSTARACMTSTGHGTDSKKSMSMHRSSKWKGEASIVKRRSLKRKNGTSTEPSQELPDNPDNRGCISDNDDVTDKSDALLQTLHKCSICFLIYATEGGLAEHLLSHEKVIPKELKDKFPLLEANTGKAIFKCDVCDKSLSSKWTWRNHMMIHSNEKPFKCEICSKSFRQSAKLREHMVLHDSHPTRPWGCPHCSSYFTREKRLQTHLLIHNGSKLETPKGKVPPPNVDLEDNVKEVEGDDSLVERYGLRDCSVVIQGGEVEQKLAEFNSTKIIGSSCRDSLGKYHLQKVSQDDGNTQNYKNLDEKDTTSSKAGNKDEIQLKTAVEVSSAIPLNQAETEGKPCLAPPTPTEHSKDRTEHQKTTGNKLPFTFAQSVSDNQWRNIVTRKTSEQSHKLDSISEHNSHVESPENSETALNFTTNINDQPTVDEYTSSIEVIHLATGSIELDQEKSISRLLSSSKKPTKKRKLPRIKNPTTQRRQSPRLKSCFAPEQKEICEKPNAEVIEVNPNDDHVQVMKYILDQVVTSEKPTDDEFSHSDKSCHGQKRLRPSEDSRRETPHETSEVRMATVENDKNKEAVGSSTEVIELSHDSEKDTPHTEMEVTTEAEAVVDEEENETIAYSTETVDTADGHFKQSKLAVTSSTDSDQLTDTRESEDNIQLITAVEVGNDFPRNEEDGEENTLLQKSGEAKLHSISAEEKVDENMDVEDKELGRGEKLEESSNLPFSNIGNSSSHTKHPSDQQEEMDTLEYPVADQQEMQPTNLNERQSEMEEPTNHNERQSEMEVEYKELENDKKSKSNDIDGEVVQSITGNEICNAYQAVQTDDAQTFTLVFNDMETSDSHLELQTHLGEKRQFTLEIEIEPFETPETNHEMHSANANEKESFAVGQKQMETLEEVHEGEDNQLEENILVHASKSSNQSSDPELDCVSADKNSREYPDFPTTALDLASNANSSPGGSIKVVHLAIPKIKMAQRKSSSVLRDHVNKEDKQEELSNVMNQTNEGRNSSSIPPYHSIGSPDEKKIRELQSADDNTFIENDNGLFEVMEYILNQVCSENQTVAKDSEQPHHNVDHSVRKDEDLEVTIGKVMENILDQIVSSQEQTGADNFDQSQYDKEDSRRSEDSEKITSLADSTVVLGILHDEVEGKKEARSLIEIATTVDENGVQSNLRVIPSIYANQSAEDQPNQLFNSQEVISTQCENSEGESNPYVAENPISNAETHEEVIMNDDDLEIRPQDGKLQMKGYREAEPNKESRKRRLSNSIWTSWRKPRHKHSCGKVTKCKKRISKRREIRRLHKPAFDRRQKWQTIKPDPIVLPETNPHNAELPEDNDSDESDNLESEVEGEKISSLRMEIPVTDPAPSTSENGAVGQQQFPMSSPDSNNAIFESDKRSTTAPADFSPIQNEHCRKPGKTVQMLFKCPFCFVVFPEAADFIKHLTIHSKNSSVKENVEATSSQDEAVKNSGVQAIDNAEGDNLHATGMVGNEEETSKKINRSISAGSLEKDSGTCEDFVEAEDRQLGNGNPKGMGEVVQSTTVNEMNLDLQVPQEENEGISEPASNNIEGSIGNSESQLHIEEESQSKDRNRMKPPHFQEDRQKVDSVNMNDDESEFAVNGDDEDESLFLSVSHFAENFNDPTQSQKLIEEVGKSLSICVDKKQLKPSSSSVGKRNTTRILDVTKGRKLGLEKVKGNKKVWIKSWLTGVGPPEAVSLSKPTIETTENATDPMCKCDVCGKTLSNKHVKHVHMRIHTGEMPYKCIQCPRRFRQLSNLTKHLPFHDPSSHPYKCSLCSLYYSTNVGLKNHKCIQKRKAQMDSKGPASVYSKAAMKRVRGRGKMIASQRREIDEMKASRYLKPFTCAKCGTSFSTVPSLKAHVQVHDKTRPWKCSKCDFYFLTNTSLKAHERLKHRTITDHQPHSSGRENNTRSSTASKISVPNTPFDTSIRTKNLKRRSSQKGKKFPSDPSKGEDKNKTLPQNKSQPPQLPQSRPCWVVLSKCDKLVDSYRQPRTTPTSDLNNGDNDKKAKTQRKSGIDAKEKMLVQMIQDEDISDYNDDQDMEVSDEGAKLPENHSPSTKDKPNPRPIGKARGPTIAVAYKKMKTFNCTMCSATFFSLESAKSHLLTHKELYKCPICSKEFDKNDSLKRHILIHSGVKPHQCLTCFKRFREASSLKKHIGIHTGEKLYPCPTCSKKFRQKCNLKRHIRIHTGERPHKCSHCSRDFTTSSNLNNHVKRLHRLAQE